MDRLLVTPDTTTEGSSHLVQWSIIVWEEASLVVVLVLHNSGSRLLFRYLLNRCLVYRL
jgi:hypothetical protein